MTGRTPKDTLADLKREVVLLKVQKEKALASGDNETAAGLEAAIRERAARVIQLERSLGD